MDAAHASIEGWQIAMGVHAALTILALWPARQLLRRAGLPAGWMGWLALPLFGWAVFATLLAFRPWPALPARPEKLHPRERLKRERARKAAAAAGEG
ncbi:hypothetical protein [Niveispirillum fermenti]|uniref:hypothetical protein n=1 Tax=Niveispirillum fermenti TaxID=1233113 RepID=UPI003A8A3F74